MIADAELIALLGGLQELLPLGKRLTDNALVLACSLFPLAAKSELSLDQLTYAVQQRVLDPEPATEQAITQQLLRYVYPLRDNQPCLEQGLRRDLRQRMAEPQRFHPLSLDAASRPAAEVLQALSGDRLLPDGSSALEQLDLLCGPLVQAVRGQLEQPDLEPSPRLKDPRRAELYAYLAAACAVGRMPVETLDAPPSWWRPQVWGEYGNGVREWIRTHPTGWALMQTLAEQQQADACDGRDDGADVLGLAGPFGSAVRSLRN